MVTEAKDDQLKNFGDRVAQLYAEYDDHEWAEAVLVLALDEPGNDLTAAIEQAEKTLKKHPSKPKGEFYAAE